MTYKNLSMASSTF